MLSDFLEVVAKQKRVTEPDGFGGVSERYESECYFDAAICRTQSAETDVAEKNALQASYTVIVPLSEGVTLLQDDRFWRHRDGKIYRVTSKPDQVPDVSSMGFYQVTAEVVE